MLRLLLVLLLLANGLYFAWSHGHLAGLGLAPANPSEPDRVQRQIKPEAVQTITAKEAKALEAQSRKPAECMQSELLTEAEAKTLRLKIEASTPAWPTGSWVIEKVSQSASWMIYMGPYPDAASRDKKKAELKRMNVAYAPVHPTALGMGLSLGQHGDKAALDKQLAEMTKLGVRTARIVPKRTAAQGLALRIPEASDELKPQMDRITGALPQPLGAALHKCGT